MKRLIDLIVGGIFFCTGLVFSQEIPKNLRIPDRFNDYRKKEIIPLNLPINVTMEKYVYHLRYFDTDRDRFPDVIEFYFEIPPVVFKYPLYYGFDINNDKKINSDKGEIFIDKKMDDWNGNEEIMF